MHHSMKPLGFRSYVRKVPEANTNNATSTIGDDPKPTSLTTPDLEIAPTIDLTEAVEDKTAIQQKSYTSATPNTGSIETIPVERDLATKRIRSNVSLHPDTVRALRYLKARYGCDIKDILLVALHQFLSKEQLPPDCEQAFVDVDPVLLAKLQK